MAASSCFPSDASHRHASCRVGTFDLGGLQHFLEPVLGLQAPDQPQRQHSCSWLRQCVGIVACPRGKVCQGRQAERFQGDGGQVSGAASGLRNCRPSSHSGIGVRVCMKGSGEDFLGSWPSHSTCSLGSTHRQGLGFLSRCSGSLHTGLSGSRIRHSHHDTQGLRARKHKHPV